MKTTANDQFTVFVDKFTQTVLIVQIDTHYIDLRVVFLSARKQNNYL